MINPDVLEISTMFLPAKVSPGDPLAQREHLAIKLTGALSTITTGDTEAGIKLLRDTIAERVESALREALKKPDETVFSITGSC